MAIYNYANLAQDQLAGRLPQDVINQIAQRAAERGVGTGVVGGPQSNAAYLGAIGRTSLDLQEKGQRAAEFMMQQALAERKLALEARQIEANLSLEEKRLAQQLGISNQEFALKKAELNQRQEMESARLGEEQRQFNLNMPLKERELGERERANSLEYALGSARLGESGRQFDIGQNWEERQYNDLMPMKISQLSPTASWNYSWLTGTPRIPSAPSGQASSSYPMQGWSWAPYGSNNWVSGRGPR